MDRRDFMKTGLFAAGTALTADFQKLFAAGTEDKEAGKKWKGWKKGHFQIHCIYTGNSESMFLIFPDGTTMMLDCGDHEVEIRSIKAGREVLPVLPNTKKHPGEWCARYVQRVNPSGKDVDYMMLSHYHSDHGGCETYYAYETRYEDKPYYLSGFSQAAEQLNFHHAIDRCWPDYTDPIPLGNDLESTWTHMKKFYDRMQKERGMEIEQFKLGAVDQIKLLKNRSAFPDFTVRNITANGRICGEDGIVKDLYAERIRRDHPTVLNENGMSLGVIFTYGKFKFYTAGDFSDHYLDDNGHIHEIEDDLAEICGHATVAKVNHHGHYSMPEKLVKALSPQVWLSCVWDEPHNVPPVMERLADRNIYPGDRAICPNCFPSRRYQSEKMNPYMKDVPAAALEAGHVVVDVEPGGEKFSVTYISADDETMTVRSVMRFNNTGA